MLGFREGMYYMLTGDNMSGTRAAELGFANEAVPAAELDAKVLDVAARVAIVPSDLQMVNKRSVHRQMEAMGIRNGLRIQERGVICLRHYKIAWTPGLCGGHPVCV